MTAMRYATANVLTQGVGMVTGLQSKFDWKSVAASAAGGAVQSVVGDALQGHALPEGMAGPVVPPTFAGLGDWGGDLARRTVTSFASGVTTAVMRGGRISVVQVATDAFGNALGSAYAESTVPGMLAAKSVQHGQKDSELGMQAQGQGPWSNADYRNGSDIQSDDTYMQRQRETLYGLSTGVDRFSFKATGGDGLSYAGRRATVTIADDTRVISDSADPSSVREPGQLNRPMAQLALPVNPALNGVVVGGGYQVVRPAGAGAPPPYDLRTDMPTGAPGYALPDIKFGAGSPPLVNGLYGLMNLAVEGFARPTQSLLDALGNLTYSLGNADKSNDQIGKNPSLSASRASELSELFNHGDARSGLQIGNRTVLELPNSGKAKVFSGVAEDEVKKYFEELSGTELPNPIPLTIRENTGVRYTVDNANGNFVLRDVSASVDQTGAAWTIEIPRGIAHPKARMEIKFLK